MPNVYVLDDDVIVSEYGAHSMVTLQDIQEEFDKRLQINNAPHLLLVKLHGMALLNKDAQAFLASKEHSEKTIAAAIVNDESAGYYEQGKIILEMFELIHDLKFAMKLFDDEDEAINWLQSQKNK